MKEWSKYLFSICSGILIGAAVCYSPAAKRGFDAGYKQGKNEGEALVIFREQTRLLLPGSVWKRVAPSNNEPTNKAVESE